MLPLLVVLHHMCTALASLACLEAAPSGTMLSTAGSVFQGVMQLTCGLQSMQVYCESYQKQPFSPACDSICLWPVNRIVGT